jgi:hypothetical protein
MTACYRDDRVRRANLVYISRRFLYDFRPFGTVSKSAEEAVDVTLGRGLSTVLVRVHDVDVRGQVTDSELVDFEEGETGFPAGRYPLQVESVSE